MILDTKIYSVPKNYAIVEIGGLKGLVRRGKEGDKWICKPVYRNIIVARSYNKIFICKDAGMYEDYMVLTSYTGKLVLDTKIYDIIFGEEFIYIKTERKTTGTIEWCLLNDKLTGGIFLGDAEFIDRGFQQHHMRKFIKYTTIQIGDEIYRIELATAKIEQEIPKETQVEEEAVTHGDVVFSMENEQAKGSIKKDSNSIQIVNSSTKRLVVNSGPLGELESYQAVVVNILGGTEGIPIERCKEFVRFTRRLEKYANSLIFPVMYSYVTGKLGSNTDKDAITKMMNEELESGWVNLGGDLVKGYITGSVGVILTKRQEDRVIVTPFMINTAESEVDKQNLDNLLNCYKSTGNKNAKLTLIRESEIESEEGEFDKLVKLPYCIEQRKGLAKSISDFNYGEVKLLEYTFDVIGIDNKSYGNLVLTTVKMSDFKYRVAKKKGVIETAKMQMVIVNND